MRTPHERHGEQMLSPDPVRTAARQQKRIDRLGEDAKCVLCGENNLAVLDYRQGHHVANRVNNPDMTVVLCANHHRAETEALAAAGVPTRYASPPMPLERLAAVLAGVAAFLLSVGAALRDWARWLNELQARLTDQGLDLSDLYPIWTPGKPQENR